MMETQVGGRVRSIFPILFVSTVVIIQNRTTSVEGTTAFDNILKNSNYDQNVPPFSNEGTPITVTNQIYIMQLADFRVDRFTYEISYLLRQWWRDPRLARNIINASETDKPVQYDHAVNIWYPHLSVMNSDLDEQVGDERLKIDIDKHGNIYRSQHRIARCHCRMDLSSYPMDTQNCPFVLESYAFTEDNVHLAWHSIPVLTDKDELPISEYQLKKIVHGEKVHYYSKGDGSNDHDQLILTFIVQRTLLYYLYGTYIPITLLMIFNMGSYWVPDTALPARMTLIMTTFLSNIFILQRVGEQTVRMPTSTSLQIFVAFNIVMIVTAMVQYLVLLHCKSSYSGFDSAMQGSRAGSITQGDLSKAISEGTLSHDLSSMPCLGLSTPESHGNQNVNVLDRIFRYLTPVVYMVFCSVYFGYYLGKGH